MVVFTVQSTAVVKVLETVSKFLISFDAESLFTNIPLEEYIDLAVKYISKGNPGLKLTPSDLKCLFSFATAETHFLFKGSFYDQIDGVARGSLAPVLANLFVDHHEKIKLEQHQGPEVRHYVDDTFCLAVVKVLETVASLLERA